MPKVHLLDNLTANQIAAGEVIERPASVIKELVENALDAGALNISVDILDGGLASIRVTDDGCGMSQEDVLLAIKRHATSKLNNINDLDELKTLGFRGEALPSITAVSKTDIITRERHFDHGTKVSIEGNNMLNVEPVGVSVGTTISVSDLFFNTPARKKFMRSSGYEGGLIHEMMIHFSLSHPLVSFRLTHQNKEILNTKGINTIPDLVELFYGSEARKSLLTIEKKTTNGDIQAFITAPGFHRANRKAVHFFINARRVFTVELMKAVEDAYENLLPKARFPLAIVHMNIAPSLIDVNVHPGKLEIRFKDPAITAELKSIIEERLNNANIIPSYSRNINIPMTVTNPVNTIQETLNEFYTWEPITSKENDVKQASAVIQEQNRYNQQPDQINASENKALNDAFEEYTASEKLPHIRVIGQLNNTFILAEGEEGLYLIDQHAAHERIIFDRLIEQAQSGHVESQVLLNPIPLQLTALEEEFVIEHILPLTDLGIILEHFGPRSYLLRAIPAAYRGEPDDFFFALLEQLSSRTKKMTPADIRKEFLVMASCKGAIKAGQKLAPDAIDQLVKDLNATSNPLACPHGRPIFILISNYDILKAFQRK